MRHLQGLQVQPSDLLRELADVVAVQTKFLEGAQLTYTRLQRVEPVAVAAEHL